MKHSLCLTALVLSISSYSQLCDNKLPRNVGIATIRNSYYHNDSSFVDTSVYIMRINDFNLPTIAYFTEYFDGVKFTDTIVYALQVSKKDLCKLKKLYFDYEKSQYYRNDTVLYMLDKNYKLVRKHKHK